MPTPIPTLYEWLGGPEPLNALIARFYEKVPTDPILAPLFAHMPQEHFVEHGRPYCVHRRAVLGGPADILRPARREGHGVHMIRHHLGKGITEQQRQHWVRLLLETADEMNIPSDPEFRSALVAYLEWGSRLAVINSALSASTEVAEAPIPRPWNWGVPGGPYQPESKE